MDWWRGLSKRRQAQIMRGIGYAIFVAAIVVLAFVIDWGRVRGAFFRTDLVKEQFPGIITTAAKNTLIYTALSFVGGLAIGLLLAIMKLSPLRPYRWTANTYIEIVRGIPLLLWIIIIGFGIPISLGVRLGAFASAITALSLVTGAYMAETIRAGIQAVPRGQMEAAQSLGMGRGMAMRRIVLPQAFRIIIPPMTNELVLLLKDTSLVSVLGVTIATKELTRWGRDGVNTFANATPLIVAGLLYLVITFPLTQLVRVMEKRASRSR